MKAAAAMFTGTLPFLFILVAYANGGKDKPVSCPNLNNLHLFNYSFKCRYIVMIRSALFN